MNKNRLKRVVVSAFIMSLTIISNGQEQRTSGETKLTPRLSIKGGINLSNLYVNDVGDENVKLGGNAGLLVKIPITKGISIQPEVLYSMKGTQLNYNNLLFGSGKYRFNLDYIETPLLLVFNVARNFNIHAGPYAAFLLSAKVKDVNSNGTVRGATELNKNNFNSIDYGAAAGIGFDIDNATLGARYNYGLREVGKEGRANDLTRDSKNSVLSFYLGFGF